jgi:hypothetical protein
VGAGFRGWHAEKQRRRPEPRAYRARTGGFRGVVPPGQHYSRCRGEAARRAASKTTHTGEQA